MMCLAAAVSLGVGALAAGTLGYRWGRADGWEARARVEWPR